MSACRMPCLPDEGEPCLSCAIAYSEPEQDDEERDTEPGRPWLCLAGAVATDPTYRDDPEGETHAQPVR